MENKEIKITEKQALTELQNGFSRAERVLSDVNLTLDVALHAEAQAEELISKGKKLGEKVKVLVFLVRDFIKKEYSVIPYKSVVAVVAGLLYFINPGDIIPDVLPVVGKVDDLMVITVCWKLIESDIKQYQEWKKNKENE